MENRALLAFVLSLGFFVVWGFIMAKMNPAPPAQSPSQQDKTQPAESDSPSTPRKPAPSGTDTASEPRTETTPAPATDMTPVPEKEIQVRVTNGAVYYIFSSRGGVLKEVRLEKYLNPEGQPLNLVRHMDNTLYPLSLVTGNQEVDTVLQNWHYLPSAESIELSPSRPEAVLEFRMEHPSGLEVVRKYRFKYQEKLFEVETNVRAPGYVKQGLEYALVWGPGLGGATNSQTDYIAFSGPTTLINKERITDSPEDINGVVEHRGDLEWTSFQNKYFAAALIPETGVKSAFVEKKTDEEIYVGLKLESVQSATSAKIKVYAGTKELETLEASGHKLVRLIDYGWLGNKFAFLVKPMLKALNFFYDITHNYGWSIIFLTIVIKVVLFPLTHKSFKSMKGMQKIQPMVKIIQERNKGDRNKMNEELLDLYRKHKVNPLGGCLPMLLQIPVFISLYHALFFSIELRGAPFMLWITDLSKSDPYYVTPVLMGATMFLQQRLTPTVADPIQQKIFLMMPVVFTFLFITFPSGLVIYWTVNNLLTIAQQFYIYKIAKD